MKTNLCTPCPAASRLILRLHHWMLVASLGLLGLGSELSLGADTPGSGKSQQLQSLDETPKGLAKSEWQSIRAAYEAGQRAFMPIEGGWQARNPGQQWTTKFDESGFLTNPKGGDWSWGLELERGAEAPVSNGAHTVDKSGRSVLSYPRSAIVTEWFINDQRGLEQGWTLSAPAEIRLRVRGGLKPVVSPQSISFGGQLTYAGLKAWDATGKTVPTHFEATAQGFAVRYDDSAAQYPITIDPIAQQAYLKPAAVGTTQAGDSFGMSVAVSGDTVVIGATNEDSSTTGINSTPNESAASAGAAYVFVRSGSTWSQQAYLKAAQVTAGDNFGRSAAVNGDTVVVGADREDSSTTDINSTPDESATDAGAAYVFVRSSGTWTQQAYLKAAQVTAGDQFGWSVTVSGDAVVVGATSEDSSTTGINSTPDELASGAGAAYVFVRSAGVWTQQAYLKPAAVGTTQAGDAFGRSVAVDGDTVVVGAVGEKSTTTGINSTPNELTTSAGAAYVFVRSSGIWAQQAYLKPAAVGSFQSGDWFGVSVAVSGDTVVVGAYFEKSSTTGINSTPNELANNAGAAYVFVRSSGTWAQEAFLKATQVSANDIFGQSVSVSGDTLVVGASQEASSTTGINSTPNELAASAGAAYVFLRSSGTWSQQAYLKAAQVTASDNFGQSVSVSGDTVVVGATGEDSSTTVINSTANELASGAGAAYLYTGLGPPPFVASITPNLGTSAGGTSVTITGTNFSGATAVSFGGTAASSFTIVNATTITATTPPGTAGPASVLVTTRSATNEANTLFTYLISPPTGIALSASSIPENNATNATIGTLSTTDPDVGDSFTYTLVAGIGSDDNAACTISGAALRLSAPADFEMKNSYAVRVRSTDAGGLFFEKAFTFSITNVNELPSLARNSASITVAEGSEAVNDGTFSDPDGNASVTLSASSGTITPNNTAGTWSWAHTPTDGPASSNVTITANDGVNPAVSVSFTLAVTNIAPVFDLGANATFISGTGVLSRSVSFADSGADTWSGTVNYGDGGGAAALTVNQGAKTFDLNHSYTTNGTYTVTVTLNDDDGGSLTDTYQVSGLVSDYDITVAAGVLTITDITGNGDLLNFMEWDENVLVVEAEGRYFRYAGQSQLDSSGPVPLTGITSIVLNAAGGDDTVVMQGFYLTLLPNVTINGGNGNDLVTLNGSCQFATDANLNLDLQNDSASPGDDSVVVDTHANYALQGMGSIVMRVSRNISIDSGSQLSVENGSITLEANDQSAPPPPFVPFASAASEGEATASDAPSEDTADGFATAASEGEVTASNPPSGATTGDFVGIRVENAELTAEGNGSITLTARGGDADTATATEPNAGISFSGAEITLSGTGNLALSGTSVANGDNAAGIVFDSSNVTSGGGNITLAGSATGTGSGDNRPGIVLQGNLGSDIVASGSGALTVIAAGAPGSGEGNAGLVVEGTGVLEVENGDVSLTGLGGGSAGIVLLGHVSATGDGAVAIDGTGGGTDQPGVEIDGGSLNGGGSVIATEEGDVHITGTPTGTGNSLTLDSSGSPLVTTEGGGDVVFAGDKIVVLDSSGSGEPVAISDGGLSFVTETPSAPNPLVLTPATLALLQASTAVTLNNTVVNHAPTAMNLSNLILNENNAVDTLIGSLSATDPDLPAQSFTFELVPGAGDTHNPYFTIVGNTLKADIGLDYEWLSTMSIRLRVSDGSGGSFEKTFIVQVFNLAEGALELWRQQNFGSFTNTGSASNTFDTDGDGLVNLLEFAFGLNPASGTSLQLPQAQRVGSDFVTTFIGESGISYGAEWSPDLAQWFPITDTGTGNTHTFSVPVGSNEKIFMRLIVTEP